MEGKRNVTVKMTTSTKALLVSMAVIITAFVVVMSITDAQNNGENAEGGSITYHPYLESEEVVKVASTDSGYVLPDNWFAAPEGSNFQGWSVKIGNSEPVTMQPKDTITGITGNVVITPIWENYFLLKFLPGEGSGTMSPILFKTGQSTYPNSTFTAPSGKYFSGWKVGTDEMHYPGDTISAESSITAVAQWVEGSSWDSKELFKVRYSMGTGSAGTTVYPDKQGTEDSYTVFSGSKYLLPKCGFGAPSGYVFIDWNVKIGDADTIRMKVGAQITVTANTTITPYWILEGNAVHVTFEGDTGVAEIVCKPSSDADSGSRTRTSGSMDDFYIEKGGSFILPNNAFTNSTPDSVGFKCWDVIKTGSTNEMNKQPGTTIGINNSVTEITIKHRWEQKTTTVTYKDGNDTVIPPAYSSSWNYVLPDNWIVKENYHFTGWHVEISSGTKYDGEPGNVITMDPKYNVTIRPIWVQVHNEITFVPNAPGGETAEGNMPIVSSMTNYILPNCEYTVAGYVFNGWLIGSTIHQPGERIAVDSTLTVEATWQSGTGHQITVNPNIPDGSQQTGPSMGAVSTAASYVIPNPTFSVAGYTFKGWSVHIGSGASIMMYPGQVLSSSSITDNVTLTAEWMFTVSSYAVLTFDSGGGIGSKELSEIRIGTEIILPDSEGFTYAGHMFTSWDIGGATYNAGTIYTVQENATLTAQWADTGSVAYYGNGGTGRMEPGIPDDGSYVMPLNQFKAPKGMEFMGWSVTIGNADPVIKNPGDTITTSVNDVTVYPVWRASIIVTFLPGDGTGVPYSIRIMSGKTVFPNIEFIAPEDMYFEGWEVKGVLYQPGATIESKDDLEAVAKWTYGKTTAKNFYTITFDPNTGTGSMDRMFTAAGGRLLMPKCEFTKVGYTFLQWSVDDGKNVTGKNVGESINVEKNLILKPVWVLNGDDDELIKITFDCNEAYVYDKNAKKNIYDVFADGDMGTYTIKKGSNGQASFTLPDNEYVLNKVTEIDNPESVVSVNAMFKCWDIYSASDGSKLREDIQPGEGFTLSGDAVIKARWEIRTNKVTYDGNGGTSTLVGKGLSPVEQPYETSIESPYSSSWKFQVPNNFFVRPGYAFDGWDVVYSSSKTELKYPGHRIDNLTTDITLRARWTPIASTISFSSAISPTSGQMDTIIVDSNYILPTPDYTVDGKYFNGWSVSVNPGASVSKKSGEILSLTMGSTVVTATWADAGKILTINNGGGTGDPITARLGSGQNYVMPVNTFASPDSAKKEFSRWSVLVGNESVDVPMYPGGVLENITEDVTVKAVWKDLDYVTITFKDGNTTLGEVTAKNGTVYTLPGSFTKANNGFTYWTIDAENTDAENTPKYIGTKITLEKNIVLNSHWQETNNVYTIKFNDGNKDVEEVYQLDGQRAVVMVEDNPLKAVSVRVDDYYGIKSTEYNPEYWSSTVDANNWLGPLVKNGVEAELNYKLTVHYKAVGTYRIIAPNNSTTVNTINYVKYGGYVTNPGETNGIISVDNDGKYFTITNSNNSDQKITVEISVAAQTNYHKVFGGWTTADGTDVLPGDVVDWSLSDLYAKWITPDVFVLDEDEVDLRLLGTDPYTGGYTLELITPYANLSGMDKKIEPILMNYEESTRTIVMEGQFFGNYAYVIPGKDSEKDVPRSAPDMYGSIYHLTRERSSDSGSYWMDVSNGLNQNQNPETILNYLATGTYRSPDNGYDVMMLFRTANNATYCQAGGNVIIDNIGIDGNGGSGSHGDGISSSLFANGHILIMGNGLTNPNAKGWNSSAREAGVGPQIVAGYYQDNIDDPVIKNKKIVFGHYDGKTDSDNLHVDLGTCLIIHSGIYYNVIGGSLINSSTLHHIGSMDKPLSTYMVLKGGTTTDTVAGGITGSNGYGNIYGNIVGGDGKYNGGTFVYLVGHFMPADDYQDKATGYADMYSRSSYGLQESSILEGGNSRTNNNNMASVFGSTHVFLSGTTSVWDVQAGGRTETTHTDNAYLEVTGRAVVRHIACGTITDGASNADRNSVDYVEIYVNGDDTYSYVANIFGAGYDTWSAPEKKSMLNGTINVTIEGGNVGTVYGGGYRGSIGDGNLDVYVNILGGTIHQDVYGGGSGGVDKILHDSNGQRSSNGSGFSMSMGKSIVNGDIYVNIGGNAVVYGNVYGGGKSVPKLASFNGKTDFQDESGRMEGNTPVEVADVVGNITVTVGGSAIINGDVYGGGRGISLSSDGKTPDMTRMDVLGYSDGQYVFTSIPWYLQKSGNEYVYNYSYDLSLYKNGGSGDIEEGSRYLNFANIIGNTTVVVDLESGGSILGDVYGGSAFGKIQNNTTIDIRQGTLEGSVFGGGLGRPGIVSVYGERMVYLGGAGVVKESIYGGSKNGDDGTEDSFKTAKVVISKGTVLGSVFGGGLMGKTYGDTEVYVGYRLPNLNIRNPIPNDYSDARGVVISIGDSNTQSNVFAGGNISTGEDSEVDNPYTKDLVQGNGTVNVYASEQNNVLISGSIMGSGNACLTKGHTEINLYNFYNASPMTGIHRADKLLVDNCNLKIVGRSPITPVFGQDRELTVYDIGEFIMRNNASIALEAPIDDIGILKSYTKEGQPTTAKSPQNRFVYVNGMTVYIRSADSSGNPQYNPVEGFIMMVSTQGNYGAYALGMAGSSGGFSVSSTGSMAEADTSVSGDVCCWYIAGIEKKIITMNLDSTVANPTYATFVNIYKFQEDTDIVYTGGTFTKMSNDSAGNPYTFVRPGAESIDDNPSQLSLAIGYKEALNHEGITLYDPTLRQMTVGGNTEVQGTFFNKDGKESDINGENRDRSLTSVPMRHLPDSGTNGLFSINLCLSGKPLQGTSYVGYLTLNFQEIKQINYSAVDETGRVVTIPRSLVANTIEVRVDVYISGSGTDEMFTVEVKTTEDINGRSGDASTLIPPTYSLSELHVADVTLTGAGSGYMPNVSIASDSNYTLPDCKYIPPEGKVFAGWSVKIGTADPITMYPGQVIESVSDTLTIKPIWSKVATIMLDANGGTGSMNNTYMACGEEYVIPESSFGPSGQLMFAKWAVTIANNRSVDKYPGETVTITGDTVLKAVWAEKLNVTFDADEGIGTMDAAYVASGDRYIIPDCTFTKQGYNFLNWKVEMGDKTVVKYPGETIRATDDIELTAQWSSSTSFRVSFNPGSGTGTMAEKTVASGAKYTLPESTFVAPSASEIFYIWSVSIGGGAQTELEPGELITITNNTLVTAVWANKISVEVNLNGGSGPSNKDVAYGSSYIVPSATKENNVLSHWEYGGKRYYPNQVITVRGNMELSAVWISAETNHRIIFDANGGAGYMPVLLRGSSTYTLPNNTFTAPSEKVFDKWDVVGQSDKHNPGDSITVSGDVVIRAVWADKKVDSADNYYTISIKKDDSSANSASYVVKKDSYFAVPDNIFEVPTGKKFNGWTVDGTYTDGVVGSNLKFTPQWADVQNTDLEAAFDDGVTINGKVMVKAISNPDNTTGWSNLGNTVVWNLNTGALDLGSNNYVGTLLGNITSNVNFAVSGLVVTDIDGDTYLPTINIKFDRAGVEAHTVLKIVDKKYYTVVFIDHGLETKRYYEENTMITRDMCETPSAANFNGWYLDSQFTNRYNYNMAINDENDGLTLYARYTYTVTLDNMNGTSYTLYVSQQDSGALLTKDELPIPEYQGYEFRGWCRDTGLVYDWDYQSDRVTEDITLYARWIGNDIRVYFWYYDENGDLRLFTDQKSGGDDTEYKAAAKDGKPVNVNGEYDLSYAYQLNLERHLYPTIRWGSAFDVKDPYHQGKSILDYAQTTIQFKDKFVKWTVNSPTNVNNHVSIYNDTVVDGKVVKFVTASMLSGYDDIFDYYMTNNGGYPRVDWTGNDRPNTMEIHLLAETTTVAMKVTMGLTENDQQFASSITIDDPKEFLVYPNGPNPNNPKIVNGERQYYEDKLIVLDEFGNEYHEGDKTTVVLFYWNSDESARYYYNDVDNCWFCVNVEDITGPVTINGTTGYPSAGVSKYYYEFMYKLNKAVRNGYTLSGWHNEYVSMEHALNPSADLVRTVHVTVDENGYAKDASLITKDSEGNILIIPLLVGDFIVDPADADAEGNIVISSTPKPNTFTIKVRYNSGIETIEGSYESGAEIDVLNTHPEPTKYGYEFVGWRVKDTILNNNTYTVSASDADSKGNILIIPEWKSTTVYNVIVKNGDLTVDRYERLEEGQYVSLDYLSKDGDVFLGWKTKSGIFNDSYIISAKDSTVVSETYTITLTAVWQNSVKGTYDVVFVTEYGTAPATITGVTLDSSTAIGSPGEVTGYRFMGWQIITATEELKPVKGTFTPIASYANGNKDIVLDAVWAKEYNVSIDNVSSGVYVSGESASLNYTTVKKWYVSDDCLVQGGKLRPGENDELDPLNLKYVARWSPINYTVHLAQPMNGHVDFYLEDREGNNTAEYLTEEQVNNMSFRYGDKIRISYTPNNDSVAFIKWIVTGEYYISSISESNAILVVQGDCSIAVDESTGAVVDLMITFDAGNLHPKDLEYTRVFMHDTVTGADYEARWIPGMYGKEHYVVKVPYGDHYQVNLWYGWGEAQRGSSVPTKTLPTFENQPDVYSLVSLNGDLSVRIGSNTTFMYDVITAGFIESIDQNVTFVDTEYGEIKDDLDDPVKHAKYQFLFGTGSNPKVSVLPGGYKFVDTSGAGNPVRIIKTNGSGTEDDVVVKVTKYVGILTSDLAFLAAMNMNINNTTGGSPPVLMSFAHGFEYNTYEGFPWVNNVFAIESDINLDINHNSDESPTSDFYLNWVRTDSPADIIIQLSVANADHYVTVDVEKDGALLYDNLRYDLGDAKEIESVWYYDKSYPLAVPDGYMPQVSYDASGYVEYINITDNVLNVRIKKTVAGVDYSNNVEVTVSYTKQNAYYELSDKTYGYNSITYTLTGYTDFFNESGKGEKSWNSKVELPSLFHVTGESDKTVKRWWAIKPGSDGQYVELINDKFEYTILKTDADETDTDHRITFMPLLSDEMVTITFVTEHGYFGDGNQREVFTITKGGKISDYFGVIDGGEKITQFITRYTGDVSGDYVFTGFKCGDIVFSDGNYIVNGDMVFIAQWSANTALLKYFTYSLDESGKATISAVRDAVDDSAIPIGTPYALVGNTEITLSIQPDQNYMIDMDKIRGELGYALIGSNTYVDLNMPLAPSGGTGASFNSWKLWGNGFPIGAGSKFTENCNNSKDGFLIYVADWGVYSGNGIYTVVFASQYGSLSNNLIYSNNPVINLPGGPSVEGKTFNGWKLWNSGVPLNPSVSSDPSTAYTINPVDVRDGFVLFVADWSKTLDNNMVVKETLDNNMVVYASQYGATSNLQPYEPYYMDQYGSKYHKSGITEVYRYESDSWVTYMVTDLAGKDGQFVRQYSAEGKVYKATRDGTFYESGPIMKYTKTLVDSPYAIKLTKDGDPSVYYYVDINGVTYNSEGKMVNVPFFNDSKLIERATSYDSYGSSVYTAEFTKCEKPILGFHTKKDADSSLYNSLYECFETSYLYYNGSKINDVQFKDIFGNVWTKDEDTGEFKVYSVTVYYLDSDNKEQTQTIMYNNDSPTTDYPVQKWYFKDQYGNHVEGNGTVKEKNKISTLYLKVGNEAAVTLSVKYIEQYEYVKSLYEGQVLKYYIKKNGALVDLSGRAVEGTLYHDENCEQKYKGDYSIVMVNTKYNTYSELRENGVTYYKDTFGNKYEDWLGSPVQLPGNRGYLWTFFLKDNLDLTIYTKVISYNINFIINGVKVNQNDLNKVSTITTISDGDSTEYYGTNIPQYTPVAFDGPASDRNIVWYTDPSYTTEYDVHNSVLYQEPKEFLVDTDLADAPSVAGRTFNKWVWNDDEYNARQKTHINPYPGGVKKWLGDDDNYFYIFTADWDVDSSGTYKVVFASNYGYLDQNLIYANAGDTIQMRTLTEPGKVFNGWKIWNVGGDITTSYEIPSEDVPDQGGFILFVADWGEDITNANNVVYATEYGKAPNMQSIRKYQFLANQNISLYGYTGKYIVYLHPFDDTSAQPIKYELDPDENNQITIPLDHYAYGDYVFIGWSAYNDTSGKRAYTYAPGESVYVSALSNRLDLYPFYLADGSMVRYYNGETTELKLQLDDVLRTKESDIFSSNIINVRYSKTGYISSMEGMDDGTLAEKDVGEYVVYYYARIMTPAGTGDPSHGNSLPYYEFPGTATLKILQVDAYAIAPSVSIRSDEGGIIVVNSKDGLTPNELNTNTVITPEDIQLIGIFKNDLESLTLTRDGLQITKLTLNEVGETTVKVALNFTDDEAAAKNYNLRFIDGSLVIYPDDSSKHEHVGL